MDQQAVLDRLAGMGVAYEELEWALVVAVGAVLAGGGHGGVLGCSGPSGCNRCAAGLQSGAASAAQVLDPVVDLGDGEGAGEAEEGDGPGTVGLRKRAT